MRNRIVATFAISVALSVLALRCGKEEAGGFAGGGFAQPPTAVEVLVVSPQTVTDRFESVGTIEAGELVVVASEIDGMVKSLPFEEGGHVREGSLIAVLEDDQLAAELSRADALRDQSQASYDRIKRVVDLGAGAPQDLDDAAASLKVAEANVALAKTRLAKTKITAPFAGLVGARKISRGTFLRAGEPITELAQVDVIRVNFSVPERYLGLLKRGSGVTVSTTAFPDRANGTIDVVEPVLDVATRSARVVARVRNPRMKFRPGMSANVSAVLSERSNALTVPAEAVFVDGAQPYVFVVAADSTVSRRALELGTRMADVVEVRTGLMPGDKIVRAGHQKLFDGAKVAAAPPPEEKTAADVQ